MKKLIGRDKGQADHSPVTTTCKKDSTWGKKGSANGILRPHLEIQSTQIISL